MGEPERVPSHDDLWAYLGLENLHVRNNVEYLMRAKGRAELADMHPWSKRAVALIDWHLNALVETEKNTRTVERQRVLEACRKYQEGMNTLSDLVAELKEIGGYDDE